MEIPIKMDDLRVPLFLETPIWMTCGLLVDLLWTRVFTYALVPKSLGDPG